MRWYWMLVLGALGLAGLLSALHRLAVLQGMSLHLAYGLGYAAVAALLLSALCRFRLAWPSALQRVGALLGSMGLALADVLFADYAAEDAQQLFFSALLGAALVQVLAKMLTKSR